MATESMYSNGIPWDSAAKAKAIQFNSAIDKELRNAKEPSADAFEFELMGRGSLMEQANAYVMYELAGRKIDQNFLRDATMLIMSCVNKTLKQLDLERECIIYYAITESQSYGSDVVASRHLVLNNRFGSQTLYVQNLPL